MRRPVGQVGVMVHYGHTVGGTAHIELHPVGAELPSQPERLHRVLGRGFAGAPMRDHRCHPRQSRTVSVRA